jgi:hypothetical protein
MFAVVKPRLLLDSLFDDIIALKATRIYEMFCRINNNRRFSPGTEKEGSGRKVTKNVVDKRAGLPANWAQLTPGQRRQHRLNGFANPEGIRFVSPDAEKAYIRRAQRYLDVYNLREPDRVPVMMPLGNLPYTLGGINMHTAMYDYEKAVQACKAFNAQYSAELEVFVSPMTTPGKVLETLDYRLYAWPGHGPIYRG